MGNGQQGWPHVLRLSAFPFIRYLRQRLQEPSQAEECQNANCWRFQLGLYLNTIKMFDRCTENRRPMRH